jgi:hypothetical protein
MALPIGPYQGQDLRNYEAGNRFLPREFYSLNSPPSQIQTNTIGNTGGITNTQAAGSYMGYPSYEAWLLAQGGGGGNGGGNDPIDNINRGGINQNLGPTNITDYESEAYGVGPTWAGSWARAKDAYSKLPTPGNLIMKGIRHWKERREIKKQEKIAAEQAKIDQISQQSQAGAGAIGPRGGGAGDSSPSHMGGISQSQADAVGAANAAAGMSGWGLAQGGRIGYERGRVVNPGGYQGDIEIPDGFLEGLPNEDYQKIIEEYMKQKKHEELMRELAPSQWAAEGGRIGYERGRVVNPGGYQGMTPFMAWVKDQYGVNVKDIKDWNFYSGLSNEWNRLGGSKAEGGIARLL